MELFKTSYKDKVYKFVNSRRARLEIERLQQKNTEVIKNPEVMTLMLEINDLNDKIAETKDKEELKALKTEQAKLQTSVLPFMDEVQKLGGNGVDPEEVCIILLKNNIDYKDIMTDELAEAIMDSMADELGNEEYANKVNEISNKVFTFIRLLNDKKNQTETPKTKAKELPMS